MSRARPLGARVTSAPSWASCNISFLDFIVGPAQAAKVAATMAGLERSAVRKHGDEAGASAPAPKRRAVLGSFSEGTLLVRDTHYQIKGLCSFLHDMPCYICQD
jgi:hypothetical protein